MIGGAWFSTMFPENRGRRYADLAREAIRAGTDPSSPDFIKFTRGAQPLVDAAFLAHALLRAPHELWRDSTKPPAPTSQTALRSTRVIRPGFNNWLLFSAMAEAALPLLPAVGRDARRLRRPAARTQERLIGPDGAFPAIGRSLAYRFGAFQLLAQMALLWSGPAKSWTAKRVWTGENVVADHAPAG
ncbi:MAG: DUF2264 domain-containing protein [Bryobacteraceae bacterium]